jgi:opacity protein-like surface antigen
MTFHHSSTQYIFFALVLAHGVTSLTSNTIAQTRGLEVERKSTIDFFDELDDKSFYQQKRIYGMKNELNDYSEKLHNLKERFDRIFYGISSNDSFETPFDTNSQPQRPVRKKIEPDSLSSIQPGIATNNYPENNSSFDDLTFEEPIEFTPSENQLAFNVDSPGEFTQNNQIVSTFDPQSSGPGGYYLIISPGIAFPYKKHATLKSYRKYDPGFSVNMTGGMESGNFRVGIGGAYKRHTFHHSARLHPSSNGLSGDSETFAGFLDLGYRFPISSSLGLNLGAGVGYYLSRIEDKPDFSSRKDHDIFWTLSAGMLWNYSELLALSFNYRYFHEQEIPAHLVELGLKLAL